MTTQQQTPRDILAQFGHFLDQQETARASAQALAEQLQRELDRYRQTCEQLERNNQHLLAIIGAETPIGAFDLATTWRAEKHALMDEVAALKKERRAICDLLSADPRTVAGDTLVQAVARVSSNGAEVERAFVEETRAGVAAARGGEGG